MREVRLTVIVSQGQSRSPDKRQLETDIAAGAAALPGVEVLVVPHLYDLTRDGETYTRLRATNGPLVLCAWLFDRAAHWVLDRNGVRGQVGQSLLKPIEETDDDEAEAAKAESTATEEETQRVTEMYPRPNRRIYCIDMRDRTEASAFVSEIARIAELELASTFVSDAAAQHPNFQVPRNDTYVGQLQVNNPVVNAQVSTPEPTLLGTAGVTTVDEHPTRRWYPVIDFSRCTNCMECIDFCLFGVYGIDSVETILVEQPDNCRKGCPACSRVCPQNAIIFPQHKTPAIAGAPMDSSGFKIDLSKLFGAPEDGADAIEVAAKERDEQLILAGRQAVGLTEDLAARLNKSADQPQDELDKLIDQLDSLEL